MPCVVKLKICIKIFKKLLCQNVCGVLLSVLQVSNMVYLFVA